MPELRQGGGFPRRFLPVLDLRCLRDDRRARPDHGNPATGGGGTIAAPAENDSPLELGMKGYYQGHHFEIRGVVRLGHDAGGFWDEWYLLFDDGRWGWLAEVQQSFYLTFSVDLKQAAKIVAFDEIRLEQRFLLRTGEPPMLVAEKGSARPLGARGEIPYGSHRKRPIRMWTSRGRLDGSPRSTTKRHRPRFISDGPWPWATCICRISRKTPRTNRGTLSRSMRPARTARLP